MVEVAREVLRATGTGGGRGEQPVRVAGKVNGSRRKSRLEETPCPPKPSCKAELERLKAENGPLKARGRGVSIKVSEKGGVSVYGLGRFPVTLYKEQWAKLLDMADDIRAFIKENEAKLKKKE